jgi:hypothetical protein
MLVDTAEDFLMHMWECLLPQARATVNVVRQSDTTPNISAYTHFNNIFI